MSEFAPPGLPHDAAERDAQALSPVAIERLLADFRGWLERLPAEPADAGPADDEEPIDLHTLLGQFLAVRHEVNLQTRATRAQQEQTAEALRVATAAVETAQRNQAAATAMAQHSADDLVRPLLKALVDTYDALALAEREARRVRETVLPAIGDLKLPSEDLPLDLAAVPLPPFQEPGRPLLARLFGVQPVGKDALREWMRQAADAYNRAVEDRDEKISADRSERQEQLRQSAERVRQLLDSLLAGYRMGLQRIERALQQHGLEAIPARGEPFDPEQMEVLEAVADSGRPAGEVIEEIRRGYLWRGRVFRFAQVRVART